MILAAIPAYNESAHIYDVVKEVRNYVDSVVVFNDGSTDDTELLAVQAGAKVVNNPRNMGLGTTINRIMRYGRENLKEGDVLITFDGDGQHFARDIPVVLRKLSEGYDSVTGSRLYDKGKPGPTPYRRVLNGIATYITRLLSGYQTTDTQSGFHAFRYSVVKRLYITTKEYSWNSELYIRLQRMGASVGEVEVGTVWTPPSGGKTHATLGYGIKALGRLMLIRAGIE